MLYLSLILFVVAASMGGVLVLMLDPQKELPYSLAGVHGALAAAGLFFLAYYLVGNLGKPLIIISFLAFIATALAGGFVLSFQLRKRQQPVSFILLHGTLAVLSIGFLQLAIFMTH